MRVNSDNRCKRRIGFFLLMVSILCTACLCSEVVVESQQNAFIISDDEELRQKLFGPANKYELINSFPSYLSTEKKNRNVGLVQIYDSNIIKQFPFLSYKESKRITFYKPFETSTSVISATEHFIKIPSIEPSILLEDIVDELNFGCSLLSSQEKYVISESMLSSGSFSHIWMARKIHNQQLYVLKRIRIEKGIESLLAARREIFIGTLLRGKKGIARYEECFIQDIGLIMNSTPTLPDRILSFPWLAFRYEGVSLSQLIYSQTASEQACNDEMTSLSKKHSFSAFFKQKKETVSASADGVLVHPSKFWEKMREDDKLYKVIVYKILTILNTIHQAGIIHRDIKPENVLISHLKIVDGHIDYNAIDIHIIDFGSAILPAVPSLYPIPPSLDECTELYASPEASSNQFDQSYDSWSVGVMMLEMIFGHKQFFECDPRHYAKLRFTHGDLAESKCYSTTLRSYCVSALDGYTVMEDCISNVMKKTIQKRDVNYNYKGESNLQKLDLIRSMLVLDPKKRMTIKNALEHPYFADIATILH